jgi:hypothetical protein
MVTAFPPPKTSTNLSISVHTRDNTTPASGVPAARSNTTDLLVLDLGVLVNPPYTSAATWTTTRLLVITTDTAWPTQEQLAGMVAKQLSQQSSSVDGQVGMLVAALGYALVHILLQSHLVKHSLACRRPLCMFCKGTAATLLDNCHMLCISSTIPAMHLVGMHGCMLVTHSSPAI